MTPQQMDAIRRSFDKVSTFNGLAGAQFCEHLYAIDPELRRRFGGDPDAQGWQVMAHLAAAVRRLSDPAAAAAALRPPASPATLAGHAGAVTQAMVWTLTSTLGPEFTPEVRAAWLALCDLVVAPTHRN